MVTTHERTKKMSAAIMIEIGPETARSGTEDSQKSADSHSCLSRDNTEECSSEMLSQHPCETKPFALQDPPPEISILEDEVPFDDTTNRGIVLNCFLCTCRNSVGFFTKR
jgi:hypothetical protein